MVYAPISEKYRSKFNASQALEWFSTVDGLDYGYHNMLWSWFDTTKDNFPCLPPHFDTCFVWDHFELIFAWLDSFAPKIADFLYTEAFNIRLGTDNLRGSGIFRRAVETGLGGGLLATIVEDDSWRYHTTRYGDDAVVLGESHVCCTFVCSMWKHGGMFSAIDGDVNCNEFTNWDVYALSVYDADRMYGNRPEACRVADPSSGLCQLSGVYSVDLSNGFNSRVMSRRMSEHCPGYPPEYSRPPVC
jgi:hypothetical protein